MNDSPRLRVDLSEFDLLRHYNLATLIENQETRACRALVYGPYKGMGGSPVCAIGTIDTIGPVGTIWTMGSVCSVCPVHDVQE